MLYLLDANSLIDANRDYYPIERVPEFWSWLRFQGEQGRVKVPVEVYEEVTEGKKDAVTSWIKLAEVKEALLLDEEVRRSLVVQAVEEGYATDLTDDELEKIGRDPFLVAYGLIQPATRTIITTEVSKPSKQRGNRRLPDVCAQFGIKTTNTFGLIRQLDFSTGWRS